MQTVALNRLTPAYLHKLARNNYIASATLILLVVASAFWMLFHIGGNYYNIVFADSSYALAGLIGACWSFQTAFLARYGPVRLSGKHQLAWLVIGIALTCQFIGGSYYLYLEAMHYSPFPSISDIFFNCSYPLLFIGLLLMPTTTRFRARMGLDALVTILCVFGVSWFFLIGPAYMAQRSHISPLELFVALSYPVWDIVLILAIVLLIQRRAAPVLQFSLLIFGCGLLANIWADSGYAYQNVFSSYTTGTFYIDPFWVFGFTMIGISGLYQYFMLARRTYNEHALGSTQVDDGLRQANNTIVGSWRKINSLLVYVPLMLLFALTVYGESVRSDTVSFYLVIITALAGILVAARYLLTTRENELLLYEREQQHKESERLHNLSTYLADVLDLERLQEEIVALTITDLGFDVAMLVLAERRGEHIDALSHLQVRTAAATRNNAHQPISRDMLYLTKWRFHGPTVLYSVIEDHEITEVIWTNYVHEIPQEVYQWQQDVRMPSLLFFPLLYQEKVLGCLGVARRNSNGLNIHDISVIKTYCEETAIAIEHAYLYQERREHEDFARALATIAARLNAAVVEPEEIQQVICREATNALQADFAVLYQSEGKDQLFPVASALSVRINTAAQGDWPIIHGHEYETQAFREQRPLLMQIHRMPEQSTQSFSALQSSTPGSVLSVHSAKVQNMLAKSRTNPIRAQRRASPLSLRERLARYGVHTAVLAPLFSGKEAVGLLVIARSQLAGMRDTQAFDETDLPQVQAFVEQAVVALTNAQQYQDIQNAHQRLKELDKLKDQFMITASHELRTPLTAVQGYLELLSQYGEMLPVEQQQEFLQKARRGCEELVVMLGNVMDASRLEIEAGIRPALLEPVPLQEMIESVIDLIGPQVTKEQREVYRHIPSTVSVIADPPRFRQVLMNVSVNALKYSPAQTPLEYSVRLLRERGSWAIISISDRGNGIKSEEQKKLFQRFVRLEQDVNSAVRGSGLGLYISRRLIEAMGGKIWLESSGTPGEGTTFHIQLPLAQ